MSFVPSLQPGSGAPAYTPPRVSPLRDKPAGVFQTFARPAYDGFQSKPAAIASVGGSGPVFLTATVLHASPVSGNVPFPALSASSSIPTEKKAPPTVSARLASVARALGFFASVLLLKRFSGAISKLHNTVLAPDLKEWLKVGLGIAGMSQGLQALNWKPPVWLNAMMNVAFVSPLVAGFSKGQFVQGLMLAPVVGGLAEAAHWASTATEKPLNDKLHIPPPVTHVLYSILMVLAGLRILPWANQSIPRLPSSTGRASLETSAATTCVNGCCASLVCVNDIGQLGAALVQSASQSGVSASGVAPPLNHHGGPNRPSGGFFS